MKTGLWIGLAVVTIVAVVFIALTVGWAVWGRQLWAAGPFAATGGCGSAGAGIRPGMMGGYGPRTASSGPVRVAPGGCGAAGAGWSTAPLSGTLTIEEARDAAERYLSRLGYSGLEITEVMEFEYNFYAIAQEHDTGIGALELLIDKQTGPSNSLAAVQKLRFLTDLNGSATGCTIVTLGHPPNSGVTNRPFGLLTIA